MSVAKFSNPEDFEASDIFKKLKEDYNNDKARPTKNGATIIHSCKYSKKKKGGFDCQAKMKTWQYGSEVEIFEIEDLVHDHTQHGERKYGIWSKNVEKELEVQLKVEAPRRIIKKTLNEKKLIDDDELFGNRLANKIQYMKKQLDTLNTNITVDELKERIFANTTIPHDDDEPFVVEHMIQETEEDLRYVVIMSTTNLINSFGSEYVLSFDLTYNTNVEECPILVFGAHPRYGKFSPIGAVFTNREDCQAIEFILKNIKDVAKHSPIAIMADAAPVISSAAKVVFPSIPRLICYFHVTENVTKKLAGVRALDNNLACQILGDIKSIHLWAVDEQSFMLLAGLLQRKYTEEVEFHNDTIKERVRAFMLYFNKQWVLNKDARYWYTGSNPQHHTTNNSVEGHNNSLKRDITGRKRLSIPNLFNRLCDWLKEQSKKHSGRKVENRFNSMSSAVKDKASEMFHEDDMQNRLISRKVKPSDRTILDPNFGIVRGEPIELFVFPTRKFNGNLDDLRLLGKNVIKRRNTLDYDTFDTFVQDMKSIHILEKVKLPDGTIDIVCNCYNKKLESGVNGEVCVHVALLYIVEGIASPKPKVRLLLTGGESGNK